MTEPALVGDGLWPGRELAYASWCRVLDIDHLAGSTCASLRLSMPGVRHDQTCGEPQLAASLRWPATMADRRVDLLFAQAGHRTGWKREITSPHFLHARRYRPVLCPRGTGRLPVKPAQCFLFDRERQ